MRPISFENLYDTFEQYNKKLYAPVDFKELESILTDKPLRNIEGIMIVLDIIFEAHGTEVIKDPEDWICASDEWGGILYSYTNMGDEYLPTIFYDHRKNYFFISDLATVMLDVDMIKRSIERTKNN